MITVPACLYCPCIVCTCGVCAYHPEVTDDNSQGANKGRDISTWRLSQDGLTWWAAEAEGVRACSDVDASTARKNVRRKLARRKTEK